MQRKRFLATAAAGLAGASTAGIAIARGDGHDDSRALPLRRLRLPAGGRAIVAFAIGQHVNVIDTAGPWEVFQDVGAETGGSSPFDLVTVAETTDPVHATGGLTLVPHHAYDDCPQPNVIVVPAHHATTATREWLRRAAAEADVVMSVCTGAFVLAEAGLLDGRTATTHHGFFGQFESSFRQVELVRGARFVEHDDVATAAGLTSGIDLALRVVARYLGRPAAAATARYMEHESPRWRTA